ncbi:MAG: PHP domain-containing protein, partial [Geminicoccaceae bacterium]
MSHVDFVHLRVRSSFSLLQSTVRVEALAKACRAAEMPAVAVADDTNLFAAMPFCAAAKKAGVQPIVGAMVPLAAVEAVPRTPGRPAPPEHLVLLVKNAQGYGNLLRLLSRAWVAAEPGADIRVSLAELTEFGQGLICLTGGPAGPIGAALRRGDAKLAAELLRGLKAVFGDRLYLELVRHGREEDDAIEPAMLDLAYAQDVALVATNDVHFLEAKGYEAQDALLCIADGAQMAQEDRRRLSVEARFKSAAEMSALFADLPEAVANTLVIARRCAFM